MVKGPGEGANSLRHQIELTTLHPRVSLTSPLSDLWLTKVFSGPTCKTIPLKRCSRERGLDPANTPELSEPIGATAVGRCPKVLRGLWMQPIRSHEVPNHPMSLIPSEWYTPRLIPKHSGGGGAG